MFSTAVCRDICNLLSCGLSVFILYICIDTHTYIYMYIYTCKHAHSYSAKYTQALGIPSNSSSKSGLIINHYWEDFRSAEMLSLNIVVFLCVFSPSAVNIQLKAQNFMDTIHTAELFVLCQGPSTSACCGVRKFCSYFWFSNLLWRNAKK